MSGIQIPTQKHLCLTCMREFGSCKSNPKFLESIEPKWIGTKHADLIYECDGYKNHLIIEYLGDGKFRVVE
jgi:hypothetical protein